MWIEVIFSFLGRQQLIAINWDISTGALKNSVLARLSYTPVLLRFEVYEAIDMLGEVKGRYMFDNAHSKNWGRILPSVRNRKSL